GRDYKSIAGTNAAACRAACEGEAGKCLAWTYVQPGVQGRAPVCYLKDAVPEGRKDDCCTSGALDRSISVASH
ncbi:PAN domain-containing protein, partial [Acinetobacter baumannii]